MNQEIIDIAMDFLQLNPFFRMTSYECLTSCNVFDSVRDAKKEEYLKKLIHRSDYNHRRVELNIDRLEAFEYEDTSKAKYSVDDLRKMVIEEITYYNKKNNGLVLNIDKFYKVGDNSTNASTGEAFRGIRNLKTF